MTNWSEELTDKPLTIVRLETIGNFIAYYPDVQKDSGGLWCRSHFRRDLSRQSKALLFCDKGEFIFYLRFRRRNQSDHCINFQGATEEEQEVPLVLISLMIPPTAHALFYPSVFGDGHMQPEVCPPFDAVNYPTFRISSRHRTVGVVSLAQFLPYGFLRCAISG